MPKIKYRFSLSQEERDELQGIIAKGKHNSQKILNALILLNYDEDAPAAIPGRPHMSTHEVIFLLPETCSVPNRPACQRFD